MSDIVQAANTSLRMLKEARAQGSIASGERIAPGVWIDLDTDEGAAETRFEAGGTALLHVQLKPTKVGRWCTLNIDLGNQDLNDTTLLGLAVRSCAPQSTTARVAVRSFLPGGGFNDSFFADYLVSFAQESTHCDVLWLARHPELLARAEWRTLMVFLDPEGFDLRFLDMRLFAA